MLELKVAQVSKLLVPNDVGRPFAQTNQDRIHVTKSSQEILAFFPSLDPKEINPEKPLPIFDIADSTEWYFRFVYFNGRLHKTSTRDEYGITSGPKQFGGNYSMREYLKAKDAKPDDVVVFRKHNDIYYIEWPVNSDQGGKYEKVTTHGKGKWKIFWAQMDSGLDRPTRDILEWAASKKEAQLQKNSAITGKKAEEYFQEWVKGKHSTWGPPEDLTETTGSGHDFYFPDKGYMVEVKGCMGKVEPIRMTALEWETAELRGDSYWLAVVSKLNKELFEKPEVQMIQDPFASLGNNAKEHTVTQVYYSISDSDLLFWLT